MNYWDEKDFWYDMKLSRRLHESVSERRPGETEEEWQKRLVEFNRSEMKIFSKYMKD